MKQKKKTVRMSARSIVILLVCVMLLSVLGTIGVMTLLDKDENVTANKETIQKETTSELLQHDTTLDIEDTNRTENIESTENTENQTTGEVITEAATEAPTEPPTSSTEPKTVEERAQELLSTMTIEEKVGQMFISRCPETDAVSEVQKYHLGGYILFARDFEGETPDSLKQTIDSYQSASKIGMLIGVDEEGGTVVRASRYPQFRSARFNSPMNIYKSGGVAALKQDSAEKSQLLLSLGVNMNFAPVCDLPDSAGDFMYDRSFGLDVNDAIEGVSALVHQMNADNMVSVLKHFPGYGNNVDTHTGVAVDTRPMQEFRENDFRPFQAGMQNNGPCVMVSHNIINCMDDSAPASLSAPVHEVLRNELGFQGVIVTDDLSMDAITTFAGNAQAAVLAVQAGNDLLCVSDYTTQVPAVIDAVKNGTISEERINESVVRILIMKMKFGIIK